MEIRRVAGLERAEAGDLTFVANAKYYGALATTRASAVLLGERTPAGVAPPATCAVLRCHDTYSTFAKALGFFVHAAPPARGIDPLSAVGAGVTFGDDVSIGPFVSIGAGAAIGERTIVYPNAVIGPGARIGADCILHAHVSVRERVVVGDRVILHDGAVLGSDGFGFARQPDGTHMKIPQLADVVIENDVEIGANTTIDRPAVGETRIKAGAKIDNLVQIGHGVSIGERTLLAAQVGLSGSTVVEEDVVMAGQVGVAGHIRVGKGVIAAGKTGITKSAAPGAFLTGYPGIPNHEWRKAVVIFRHLPALKKKIEELEAKVADLEEKLIECRTSTDRS